MGELRLAFDARGDVERGHQARARHDLDGDGVVLLRLDAHGRHLRVLRQSFGEHPIDQRIAQRNLARQRRPGKFAQVDACSLPDYFVQIQGECYVFRW
jgi:hypothetical protein